MNKYWQPMEDFCIRFSDKTAEVRTEEQLNEMVKRINEIANEYDFGVLQYGGINVFKFAIKEEDRFINSIDKNIILTNKEWEDKRCEGCIWYTNKLNNIGWGCNVKYGTETCNEIIMTNDPQ